jgi:chromate transporter
MSTLWELFLSFLHVGALSFGGGYAAMPLIQEQVVLKHHWMSMSDFSNLVTLSQMTPGPIITNAATFVGQRVAGLPGAVAATVGSIFVPLIFVSILAYLYKKYRRMQTLQGILKGIRPAVAAMILSAGLLILIPAVWPQGRFNAAMFVLFILSFAALRKWKWDPILVMLLSGSAYLAVCLL